MSDIIATPKMTREILDRYGLKAQKKYGQNFLIDANIVAKIASQSSDKEHLTLEIGPGIGSLTQMLARYAKEVVAYEIDPKLIPLLKDNFKDVSNIHIIHEDFMDVDFKKAFYANKQINVCANLPYYVTTPILFKLFESNLDILKITVMVQKEVADRFKAKVKDSDYNALSLIVNYLYDVKTVMQVPSSVFYPRPKVDSTVISFIPKRERDFNYEKAFFALVKRAFAKRRKTLYNNLKDYYSKDKLAYLYESLALPETVRAEELDDVAFKKIYEVLK